jgi:hypothetical protein
MWRGLARVADRPARGARSSDQVTISVASRSSAGDLGAAGSVRDVRGDDDRRHLRDERRYGLNLV